MLNSEQVFGDWGEEKLPAEPSSEHFLVSFRLVSEYWQKCRKNTSLYLIFEASEEERWPSLMVTSLLQQQYGFVQGRLLQVMFALRDGEGQKECYCFPRSSLILCSYWVCWLSTLSLLLCLKFPYSSAWLWWWFKFLMFVGTNPLLVYFDEPGLRWEVSTLVTLVSVHATVFLNNCVCCSCVKRTGSLLDICETHCPFTCQGQEGAWPINQCISNHNT